MAGKGSRSFVSLFLLYASFNSFRQVSRLRFVVANSQLPPSFSAAGLPEAVRCDGVCAQVRAIRKETGNVEEQHPLATPSGAEGKEAGKKRAARAECRPGECTYLRNFLTPRAQGRVCVMGARGRWCVALTPMTALFAPWDLDGNHCCERFARFISIRYLLPTFFSTKLPMASF